VDCSIGFISNSFVTLTDPMSTKGLDGAHSTVDLFVNPCKSLSMRTHVLKPKRERK
jgi:hypothetical protein